MTVNTKLTNSSTIDNSSSIVTKEIGNQSGASITGASGSLKISSGGINDGTIEQNIVSITGGTLVNSGTINATIAEGGDGDDIFNIKVSTNWKINGNDGNVTAYRYR